MYQEDQRCSVDRITSYFRAVAVFAACLLTVFVLPFIAAYGSLPDFFFFSPQLLFPYAGLVTRDASGSHAVFSQGAANALNILHWSFVAVAFAWPARRLPIRYLVIAAIATIVLVGFATNVLFAMFGLELELDGP